MKTLNQIFQNKIAILALSKSEQDAIVDAMSEYATQYVIEAVDEPSPIYAQELLKMIKHQQDSFKKV